MINLNQRFCFKHEINYSPLLSKINIISCHAIGSFMSPNSALTHIWFGCGDVMEVTQILF